MEMLNIPPAQPQGPPTATPKTGTGKEANGCFRETLHNAGASQSKILKKQSGKAEGQEPEATADTQSNPLSGTAVEGELLATLPTNHSGEAEPLLDETSEVTEPATTLGSAFATADMTEVASPVLVGVLPPAPSLVADTKTLLQRDAGQGIITDTGPLAKTPEHGAQDSMVAGLAETSIHEDQSTIAAPATLSKFEGVGETAGKLPEISKTGAMPPSAAPAVGLRAENPTADTRRQSTPQPIAVSNMLQAGIPQGEQQKAMETTDTRKQPGLMESSLGSLLQEIRPLRQELRGQAVAEGNRVPTLAVSPGQSNPVAATAQNGDNLGSFAFEQKTESMLNGLGEPAKGLSLTADGAPFDAALTNNLHTAQAAREGTHPLATSTTEASTLRLSSGEFLSENQVVNQVLQRIHLEGGNEISRIVIKMHPEELGEVKLALTLEKDKLSAQLLAQNQQVQEILEKHLPRLHEALNHQGLRLEDIQVSVDSNRNFDREFFDKQRQSGSFRRDFSAPSGATADEQAAIASLTTRRDLTEGLSLRV